MIMHLTKQDALHWYLIFNALFSCSCTIALHYTFLRQPMLSGNLRDYILRLNLFQ